MEISLIVNNQNILGSVRFAPDLVCHPVFKSGFLRLVDVIVAVYGDYRVIFLCQCGNGSCLGRPQFLRIDHARPDLGRISDLDIGDVDLGPVVHFLMLRLHPDGFILVSVLGILVRLRFAAGGKVQRQRPFRMGGEFALFQCFLFQFILSHRGTE